MPFSVTHVAKIQYFSWCCSAIAIVSKLPKPVSQPVITTANSLLSDLGGPSLLTSAIPSWYSSVSGRKNAAKTGETTTSITPQKAKNTNGVITSKCTKVFNF